MDDRGLRQVLNIDRGPKGFGAIVIFAVVFVMPWIIPFEFPQFSQEPVTQWLFRDYTVKSLLLAVVFTVPFMRRCALSSFGGWRKPYEPMAMSLLRAGIAVLTCVFLAVVLTALVLRPLLAHFPESGTLSSPEIGSVPVYWLDMTFGLALTAVSEELAFRGVAKCMIEKCTTNRFLLVAISSVLFGLIHWSLGLSNVVYTTLMGTVYMITYLRMGSIVPPIIAHYFVNVVHFA